MKGLEGVVKKAEEEGRKLFSRLRMQNFRNFDENRPMSFIDVRRKGNGVTPGNGATQEKTKEAYAEHVTSTAFSHLARDGVAFSLLAYAGTLRDRSPLKYVDIVSRFYHAISENKSPMRTAFLKDIDVIAQRFLESDLFKRCTYKDVLTTTMGNEHEIFSKIIPGNPEKFANFISAAGLGAAYDFIASMTYTQITRERLRLAYSNNIFH